MPTTFDAQGVTLGSYLTPPGLGYYIPIYQRPYSWQDSNVRRLFEDLAYGLERTAQGESAMTFFGTVIVFEDTATIDPRIPDAIPTSVRHLIDGQQRITTLMLLGVELASEISNELSHLRLQGAQIQESIERLAGRTAALLKSFGILDMSSPGEPPNPYARWPRIIRQGEDRWGYSERDALYHSDAAAHLAKAAGCGPDMDREPGPAFTACLREIQSQVRTVRSGSFDSEFVSERLGSDIEASRRALALDDIGESTDEILMPLVRLTALGRFLSQDVEVIHVLAPSEEYGLSLFEPLNTTGQLLTALETLKPILVQQEDGSASFQQSPMSESYTRIETALPDSDSPNRLRRIDEYLATYAMSESGRKLPHDLAEQRRYLSHTFRFALADRPAQRAGVRAMADVADFMRKAWWDQDAVHRVVSDDDTRFAYWMVRKSNHSIATGLLAREFSLRETDPEAFRSTLKAVAAFWLLWRASRSTTENIDTYYRRQMSGAATTVQPAGSTPELASVPWARYVDGQLREPPPPERIRESFRQHLAEAAGIDSRAAWIERMSSFSTFNVGQTLRAALLFAAYDDAIPDPSEPGLDRLGVQGSAPALRLSFGRVELTVEHAAPQRRMDADHSYDAEIYARNLQDCLGNLTLVPAAENASLGRRSWALKRKMYAILGEPDAEVREAELGDNQLGFADTTVRLLKQATFLPFTRGLSQYTEEKFDHELVVKRSRRLAGMAWDRVAPWLEFPVA